MSRGSEGRRRAWSGGQWSVVSHLKPETKNRGTFPTRKSCRRGSLKHSARMRSVLPLTLLLLSLPAAAVEHLTVIGDSLTKEYQVTFPGLPVVGVPGIDATNPDARCWAEILHTHRNARFDSGLFRNTLLNRWSDLRLLGHEYNWAIPGATARTLRLLVTDPNAPELAADPDLAQFIAFAPDWKQMPVRLTAQLPDVILCLRRLVRGR